MIHEIIVTTRAESHTHIVPLGMRRESGVIILAPYRPSSTLELLLHNRCAVINQTDDVRVFAGCLTGRYDWPTCPAERVACNRLTHSLAHTEIELLHVQDDAQRPRLIFRPVHSATHHPFVGFNRAQAAVIEAAILVSRLDMLPRDKIEAEMAYLRIALTKTGGPREEEAWTWLTHAINVHFSTQETTP